MKFKISITLGEVALPAMDVSAKDVQMHVEGEQTVAELMEYSKMLPQIIEGQVRMMAELRGSPAL